MQAAYPTIRKVACLQQYVFFARRIVLLSFSHRDALSTTTNTLCVTETLTNLQSAVGTLSVENALNVVAKLSSLTSLPQNVVCTNCIKESYNILSRELPSTVSDAAAPLQSQCGASFIGMDCIPHRNGAKFDSVLSDGRVPLDIAQTAKGVRLDRNGATSHSATGALAFIVLVSSGIVFLA